mgnify:CR=1 FL=1|jgi:hypothetical protein
MKNTLQYSTSLLLILIALSVSAQLDSSTSKEEVILDTRGVKVIIKEKTKETTTNNVGDTIQRKKEVIEITTNRENTDLETEDDGDSWEDIKKLVQEFSSDEPKFIETSWNKFHLGLNNLMNTDGKLETAQDYGSLEISTGNSINLQWDILTQAVNLYKHKIRLVYGIGIDYNNYMFKQSVSLDTDSIPLFINQDGVEYQKNKLVTQYLNVPLMINFNLAPKNSDDAVYLSAGVNFGYLIGSHQKQIWNDDGKRKNKVRDDYSLEKYRVGYEVQFGYNNIILFGKYFPESIFRANRGPELRTVSAGILIGKV